MSTPFIISTAIIVAFIVASLGYMLGRSSAAREFIGKATPLSSIINERQRFAVLSVYPQSTDIEKADLYMFIATGDGARIPCVAPHTAFSQYPEAERHYRRSGDVFNPAGLQPHPWREGLAEL